MQRESIYSFAQNKSKTRTKESTDSCFKCSNGAKQLPKLWSIWAINIILRSITFHGISRPLSTRLSFGKSEVHLFRCRRWFSFLAPVLASPCNKTASVLSFTDCICEQTARICKLRHMLRTRQNSFLARCPRWFITAWRKWAAECISGGVFWGSRWWLSMFSKPGHMTSQWQRWAHRPVFAWWWPQYSVPLKLWRSFFKHAKAFLLKRKDKAKDLIRSPWMMMRNSLPIIIKHESKNPVYSAFFKKSLVWNQSLWGSFFKERMHTALVAKRIGQSNSGGWMQQRAKLTFK